MFQIALQTLRDAFVNFFMLRSGALVISVDMCMLYCRSVCWFVFCNCLGPVIGVFPAIGVLWAGTVFLFVMLSILSVFC